MDFGLVGHSVSRLSYPTFISAGVNVSVLLVCQGQNRGYSGCMLLSAYFSPAASALVFLYVVQTVE